MENRQVSNAQCEICYKNIPWFARKCLWCSLQEQRMGAARPPTTMRPRLWLPDQNNNNHNNNDDNNQTYLRNPISPSGGFFQHQHVPLFNWPNPRRGPRGYRGDRNYQDPSLLYYSRDPTRSPNPFTISQRMMPPQYVRTQQWTDRRRIPGEGGQRMFADEPGQYNQGARYDDNDRYGGRDFSDRGW